MTPDQHRLLAELERRARERGSDYDRRGLYVFDPDAELHGELADDAGVGLTDHERAQLRRIEAKYAARLTNRCAVCARPLAAGQRRMHATCAPTCPDCWRPATNCQCTAAVRRKRAAVAP